MFSGNKDTDKLILQELDDRSLLSACSTNSYFEQICKEESFWLNRLIRMHGEDVLILKPKFGKLSNREIYFRLTYPTYKNCQNVKRNADSNLVIEDLYGPNGYIQNETETKSLKELKNLIIFKTVYTLMDKKEKIHKINKTSQTKLRNKIKKIGDNLPEKYKRSLNLASPTLENTDIATFFQEVLFSSLQHVDVKSVKDYLLLNLNRPYDLSDGDIRFILRIHNSFKNSSLPLTITWNELCTHPTLATKLDRSTIDRLLKL